MQSCPTLSSTVGASPEASITPPPLLQVLRELQGSALPTLLGVGMLSLGHAFIATGLVHGTPLSQLLSLAADVRGAAEHALSRIHACGVVHGDIRLANMLLVRRAGRDLATGSSGGSSPGLFSGSSDCGNTDGSSSGGSSSNGGGSGLALPCAASTEIVTFVDLGRAYVDASPGDLAAEKQRLRRLLCG